MKASALLLIAAMIPSTTLAREPDQGLASTTSPKEACSRYQRWVKEVDQTPHKIALVSIAGSIAGAGIASLGSRIEVQITRERIAIETARAMERVFETQFERGFQAATERLVHQALQVAEDAAEAGAGQGFRLGSKTFSDVEALLTSPEYHAAIVSKTRDGAKGVTYLASHRRLTDYVAEAFLRTVQRKLANAGTETIELVTRQCLERSFECWSTIKEFIIGGGTGFDALKVALNKNETLRAVGREAARALYAEEATHASREAVRRLTPGRNVGTCMKVGGRFLKWMGLASSVATELLWTEPAQAMTLEQAISRDPSLLLQQDYRSRACALLEHSPEIREKFVLMTDLAEQATSRDAPICDGRATAEEYEKYFPADDQRWVREAMAKAAQ